MRTLLLLPVLVLGLLWMVDIYTGAWWIGLTTIQLEFCILTEDGKPIPPTTIRLYNERDDAEDTKWICRTDGNGLASMTFEAHVCGYDSLLRSSRNVNYPQNILISTEGRESVSRPFTDWTSGPQYHSGLRPPPIVVYLPGHSL